MNVHQAVIIAKNHLLNSYGMIKYRKDRNPDNYALNRELQYRLCQAVDRLKYSLAEFSISEKDIIMLVEAWLISDNFSSPDSPQPLMGATGLPLKEED